VDWGREHWEKVWGCVLLPPEQSFRSFTTFIDSTKKRVSSNLASVSQAIDLKKTDKIASSKDAKGIKTRKRIVESPSSPTSPPLNLSSEFQVITLIPFLSYLLIYINALSLTSCDIGHYVE
jgi:hypothetical protein